MASSDGIDKCLLHRGRSQSDPNILSESGIDLSHSADVMEQQKVLRSSCLVSGVHTPPIRRHSKLATLGRIFRPWKWRKKKNEKLKQSSTGKTSWFCPDDNADIVNISNTQNARYKEMDNETMEEPNSNEEEEEDEEAVPSVNENEDVEEDEDEEDGEEDEEDELQEQSPPRGHGNLVSQLSTEEDQSKVVIASVPQSNSFLQKELPRVPDGPSPVILRGPFTNPVGSPHIGSIHPPLPPSCIIEELHRALATKLRQDSIEREPSGDGESRKEAEENKENVRQDHCFTDASGIIYDADSWNESVISGTLPRRMRKELLAVKLRNRPSKQELEDKNIFPARSDQERQEIRQQIEMKLAKRLSQRPAVEELESRNILKQRNDQTEQEERREIKQRLNRKVNNLSQMNLRFISLAACFIFLAYLYISWMLLVLFLSSAANIMHQSRINMTFYFPCHYIWVGSRVELFRPQPLKYLISTATHLAHIILLLRNL
uniref:Phosphatase and actin regulator n=1 Tax=Cyprinus carpio TaxID=7962 RepID=A0A8C1X7M6_CYPCA